jgi:hypothetical protein
VEKPGSVAVLDTLKPVRLVPTAIPVQRNFNILPSEWHTYTVHVSILLSPVPSTSSALVDINKGS